MLRVRYIHLVAQITSRYQILDRNRLTLIRLVFVNNLFVENFQSRKDYKNSSTLLRNRPISISNYPKNTITLFHTLKYLAKKKSMSIESNSTELEVSCFISTGEFTYEESGNSLIEEQRSALYLRQLRYEEYFRSGLQKKRDCMEGVSRRMCIRVMSYNVLSQQLLEQHRYLYRNQSPDILRWDYRHPRLLAEILLEDPDILCLQEVQESHISTFYNKLEDLGYKGIYKKRTGGKADGCAIYFRTCLFDLIDWLSVEYFQPRVSVLNRDNVGLVVKLKPKGSPPGKGEFVVGTTHLLYNPRRHDVRLAQIQLFLAEVHRMAWNGETECGVIMTGDLNAHPNSPVLRLIIEGSLDHNYSPLPNHLGILSTCTHANLASPQLYNSERQEMTPSMEDQIPHREEIKPYTADYERYTNVSHPFNFHSVYSLRSEEGSTATTFQEEWITVDYIFYSWCEQIELLSKLRLPTKDECSKFIRNLPNYASPSDHLPLAATFSLKLN